MCFDARKTKHSLVRRLLNIARAKTTSSPFLLGSGADTVHLTRHTRHQREFTVTACRQSHSLRTHTHAKPNTLGVVGWEVEKTSPDNEHTKITVKKKKKKEHRLQKAASAAAADSPQNLHFSQQPTTEQLWAFVFFSFNKRVVFK